MVDPKYLQEVIDAVQTTMRIKDFEKMVLIRRFKEQGRGWWKRLRKSEIKDMIKKVKMKHKGMELP